MIEEYFRLKSNYVNEFSDEYDKSFHCEINFFPQPIFDTDLFIVIFLRRFTLLRYMPPSMIIRFDGNDTYTSLPEYMDSVIPGVSTLALSSKRQLRSRWMIRVVSQSLHIPRAYTTFPYHNLPPSLAILAFVDWDYSVSWNADPIQPPIHRPCNPCQPLSTSVNLLVNLRQPLSTSSTSVSLLVNNLLANLSTCLSTPGQPSGCNSIVPLYHLLIALSRPLSPFYRSFIAPSSFSVILLSPFYHSQVTQLSPVVSLFYRPQSLFYQLFIPANLLVSLGRPRQPTCQPRQPRQTACLSTPSTRLWTCLSTPSTCGPACQSCQSRPTSVSIQAQTRLLIIRD